MSQEKSDASSKEQPRQPQNLQGLMRFAIEANTQGEDTSLNNNLQPMDTERRNFLENTLKSLTVDVIEILQNCIAVLHENKNRTDQDETECITALETIQEYVDNLDTANDFFKIGGFSILPICLSSPWPSVRSHGCEIIADLAQNNPFCQENLLKCHIARDLLKLLLDKETVAVKAMYAISCMVRNYDPALDHLLSCGGLNSIVSAIGSKESENMSDKLRTKGSFLLRALCLQDARVRSELVKLNAVEQLCSVLTIATESREHIMSALLSIMCSVDAMLDSSSKNKSLDSIGKEAAVRAKKSDLKLEQTLSKFLNESRGKPEYQEVFDYSTRLQNIVFATKT